MKNMMLIKMESTPIILKKVEGKWWEIHEDLRIKLYLDTGIIRLTIKKGFRTDLGSIPSWAQGWISDDDENVLPFLIHDFGYVYGGFSQFTWDDLLRQALRLKGMGYWKALTVFKAVDWFGGSEFDNSPEDEKQYCHMTWDDK
jgi:hypothetical protein